MGNLCLKPFLAQGKQTTVGARIVDTRRRLIARWLLWVNVAIHCGVVLLIAGACVSTPSPGSVSTPSMPTSLTEYPTVTTTMPEASPIPVTPAFSTPVFPFSMQRVESTPFFNLKWDAEARKFTYLQSPLSEQQNGTSCWSFDPIQGTREPYNECFPYHRVDDDIKRELGVYDGYMSPAPGGGMVFIRAKEANIQGAPLPVYEFVDLWYADEMGRTLKLGSLPLPYSEVIWLDDGQSVLVTIGYESMDAGIDAFIFETDGSGFTDLFGDASAISAAIGRETPIEVSLSPDGRWIACTTWQRNIWLIDREDMSVGFVDSAAIPTKPLWSQDGQYLYYVKGEPYGPGSPPSAPPLIAQFSVDNEQIRLLTSPGEIGTPIIREWAVSGNGQYFLIAAEPILGFLEGGMWLLDIRQLQD